MIVHCPTRFRPRVSDEFFQLTDIPPTLLSLTALGVPETLDGQDISPLLANADSG